MNNIHRNEVFKLIAKCRILFSTPEEISELLDWEDISENQLESEVINSLAELYKGVTNGYLSDFYESITGRKVDVIGEVFELYKCPCCGLNTLTEIFNPNEGTGYDICSYCNWEDDGTEDVSSYSGVNKGTISEYRDKIENNSNYFYRNRWLAQKS